MVTDPVCKKELNPADTQFSSDYENMRYFFCSEDCKRRFDHDPPLHLTSDAQEALPIVDA